MDQNRLRNQIRANLRTRCLEAGLSWERVKEMNDNTLLNTAQRLDRLTNTPKKKEKRR